MVDFTKKIINSDKFRKSALTYQSTGRYCAYPANTSEFMKFWDEEQRRCTKGYTADDGDYITGYNYFYLNYCPIERIVYEETEDRFGEVKKVRRRKVEFPDFYDYDYYFFHAIEEAEDSGKHMCVLKSRRKGYSYKLAAMACRNFYLIPNSKSYVYASDQTFLLGDGTFTKVNGYMSFIDKNTAFAKKKSINKSLHKRAGFITKDEFGNEVEMGYKSEIIGLSLKDDPNKVRGRAGKLIIFEEAGTFSELGAAWSIARPSVEQDGIAYGLMLASGTGGDDKGNNFTTLKDMFYHPDGYNCISFPNIWDEHAEGTRCGFFCPQYSNLANQDEEGNRLYMDKDGNTKHKAALDYILSLRKEVVENASNSVTVDRYCAENCITPAEACLNFNGNIFPKKELQEQLALIRTNKNLQNHKQIGDLIWGPDGDLKWLIKKTGDITHFPLKKDDDPTGSIVIWEHPKKDASVGLYVAGCLTPGEKVLTDHGYKKVEDVGFNDRLVSKDGGYVKIHNLQRYDKIDEPVYKVRVSHSYSTTTFTQEHPLYVANQKKNGYGLIDERKFDFSFQKMKDVKEGQWIKYPNLYNSENNFDINSLWTSANYRIDRRIDSPLNDKEFWWFVGLWLGDGWCCGKYNVTIVFNSAETEYIDRYRKLSKLFNRPFYERYKEETHSLEISFNCQQLVDFLNRHFGKYAYGKNIPEWVKRISPELKKGLLQGYLDSDGCVYRQGKYSITGFVSVNLKLLEDIQDILFSLGLISNMSKLRNAGTHKIKKHVCNVKECYQLRMAYHDSIKFKAFYTNYDHKLEKIEKVDKMRSHPKDGCFFSADMKYIYFKIREIEKSTYTGVVYNFECDTHTFLCRNITTHNCDPYDHDQSGTNSLGSVIIYKRIQNLEEYSDIIVAEYTGRPESADEFYENVRKLLIYYNARLMYENQNKGLFVYFTNKHCDYLLADQPDIINDVVGGSKVQRKKGCHMNKQIKQWGEGLIKDWLNDINANGKKNLYNILSEPLLEELIDYNDTGNFDRVCALLQVMIYREQLFNIVVKEKEKENKARILFEGPIFSQNWFRDETPTIRFDNDNVYTF